LELFQMIELAFERWLQIWKWWYY